MHKIFSGLKGYMTKTLALLALVLFAAAMPYGCSKAKEEKPAGTQETAAADPAMESFDMGVKALLQSNYDEAVANFEASLQVNPSSAEAHNNLGFSYMHKGNLDKAVEHQKKALELNPNLANAYYGLAMALEKKGDKKEALKNWKQFASMSQPHTKWWIKAQEKIAELEGTKKEAAKPAASKK